MSHYETLNVPKGADKDTIKKAFRSKAKKAHPDKGGSTDEMSKLNFAYAVLSDASRKAQYDETGDDKQAPSEHEASHGVLVQFFGQALESGQPDPVEFARANLNAHLQQMAQVKSATSAKLTQIKAKRDSVSVSSGVNLFQNLVDQQISQGEAQVRQIAQQEINFRSALELLNNYSTKLSAGNTFETRSYTYASTTSTL